MTRYFAILFFLSISFTNEFNSDGLKQAKVIEFLSTKTINYIDDLKRTGDNKYYHFHKQLDAYFERAKARVALNNIADAHLDLDQILLRDPEYWDAYYYKGKLFMMVHDYESALPYLEIAAENDLELADLFLLRGIARFEVAEKDRGISDFERLLNMDILSNDERFSVLFYYSKISFISGDLDKSLASAIQAYDIQPQNIELLKHKGNLYRLLNMPEQAILYFNKALSLGYNNRELYLYRGLSYIDLNKIGQAELDLSKYLSLAQNSDSNRPQALLELAIVKFHLGEKEEALNSFNEVIDLMPLENSSYAYRGVIYYEKEIYDKAIEDFNIGIQSGLFKNYIHLYRGNSNFYLENYKLALKDLNIYLSKEPKNNDETYEAYINRSIIFYKSGYYKDALTDINYALEIKDDDGKAYVHRANINRYLDKINNSMSDLNKALDLGENHIDIYLSRGLIHSYNGNCESAEKDLSIFLNNNKESHNDKLQAILKRGICRYNLDKFELALEDFNDLLLRDSSIIEAYRYRAEIYLINGKKQLAKRDLNQALLSSETIPEIYLLRGIVELSLNNFSSAIVDFNQFINLVSDGHPDYFHAFHERGIAEFFVNNLSNACIDWNYAAVNGYSKSMQLIQKNCNLYSESPN